ncbi:MAG: TVP38/TMEM64 family protein [Candidatus Nanoarchaeia archaeon]
MKIKNSEKKLKAPKKQRAAPKKKKHGKEGFNDKIKEFLNHKISAGAILKLIITAAIIIVLFLLVKEIISSADSITNAAKAAGKLGPVVLILLISLGILLTPIPSIVLIIAAGYLYGFWLGALYSYLGHILAALGAFSITRLLKTKVEEKKETKYHRLIKDSHHFIYFFYIVPIIPISVTSIVTGTSKIGWLKFIKIVLLSFILPVLFFSFFGDKISAKNLTWVIIGAAIILVGSIIVFRLLHKKTKTK